MNTLNTRFHPHCYKLCTLGWNIQEIARLFHEIPCWTIRAMNDGVIPSRVNTHVTSPISIMCIATPDRFYSGYQDIIWTSRDQDMKYLGGGGIMPVEDLNGILFHSYNFIADRPYSFKPFLQELRHVPYMKVTPCYIKIWCVRWVNIWL